MPLSVGDALRDGLGRTFERNGLQLVAAFFGLRLVARVTSDTLTRANLELAEQLGGVPGGVTGGVFGSLADAPTPYALGLSLPAALLLALAVAVVGEAVRIVAVRTLVGDCVDGVPAEYWRRNLATATLNGFVGGVIVLTLSLLGLALLVVPGVFLALSFYFVRQEIAVRDATFVDAMAESWALSSGHRLELLGLAAVVVLAEFVVPLPGVLLAAVDPTAGAVVGAALQAVAVVFGTASACRAYAQLRAAPAPAEPEPVDPYAGALGPDDLPAPGDEDA